MALAYPAPSAGASGRALDYRFGRSPRRSRALTRPPRTIERIDVHGNFSVREKVIRRMVLFSAGDHFDARRLVASKRRLMGSGLFSSVTFATARGTARSRVVIRLQVTERSMGQFFIFVGVGRILYAIPLSPLRTPARTPTGRP